MVEIDFWRNRTVLVTGASGFIGKSVVKRLEGLGADVITILFEKDFSCDLKNVHTFYGSITDYYLTEYVISMRPSIVIHLAAQALVETGQISPLSTIQTNVLGTMNLLEACRVIHTPDAFVVASTDKVYGRQEELPYTLQSPLLGTWQIYEASKVAEDVISQAYRHSYGLPLCITRFGNVYGEMDTNFDRVIPGTIHRMMRGEKITLRSDGKSLRDYLYISDVVDGYLMLAQAIVAGKCSSIVYNFGTETPISVIEVVETIQRLFGAPISYEILGTAIDEIQLQSMNYADAYRDFGWKPSVNLLDGLKLTIEWFKKTYG